MGSNEHHAPRTYDVDLLDTIVTVPNDPENGGWIAFLQSDPTVWEEAYDEGVAVFELLKRISKEARSAEQDRSNPGGL